MNSADKGKIFYKIQHENGTASDCRMHEAVMGMAILWGIREELWKKYFWICVLNMSASTSQESTELHKQNICTFLCVINHK